MSKILRFSLAALIGLFVGMIFPLVQFNLVIITFIFVVLFLCDWDLEFALRCIVAGCVILCFG